MSDNEESKTKNFLRAPISGSGFGQFGGRLSSTATTCSSSTIFTGKPNSLLRPSALTDTAEKLRTDKQSSTVQGPTTSDSTSIPSSSSTPAKSNIFGKNVNDSLSDEPEKGESSFSNGKETDTNETQHSSLSKVGKTETRTNFIFGEDISSRVVDAPCHSSSVEESGGVKEFKDITASSSKFEKEDDDVNTSKSLVESAQEYQDKLVKLEFEEVQRFTGEEGESNVLQMIVKAFYFDKEKSKWLERGRGFLHLNDLRQSDSSSPIKSRIILRVQGSLKVVINTFIFPEMVLEMATEKSIRFSAKMEDGLKMFLLIFNTTADADLFFDAIQGRKCQRSNGDSPAKENSSLSRFARKRSIGKNDSEVDNSKNAASSCSPKKFRGDSSAPPLEEDGVSSSSSSSTATSSLEQVEKISRDTST